MRRQVEQLVAEAGRKGHRALVAGMVTPEDRLVCDLGARVGAHMGTVDALARVQLTARRLGRVVALRAASDDLLALLAFAGLNEALPRSGLGLEAGGQAEQREQLLRPQEERELDDPAA